jgi:GTPase
VPCSARTGEGCAELEALIRRRIPEGPPLFPEGFAEDLPLRLGVGERIREQVLLRTRQEVPHSTAVVVDRIDDPGPGGCRVSATIFVDRESQKGILIGRGGEMLKAIGTASRAELAGYLGHPVHLSLWVKVKQGWREDPLILRLLGISPDP